jgi:hypothetical protein
MKNFVSLITLIAIFFAYSYVTTKWNNAAHDRALADLSQSLEFVLKELKHTRGGATSGTADIPPIISDPKVSKEVIPGSIINGHEWIKGPPTQIEQSKTDKNDGASWVPSEISDQGQMLRSGRWTKKTDAGLVYTQHTVTKIVSPSVFIKEQRPILIQKTQRNN